jgi:hypothetical protein
VTAPPARRRRRGARLQLLGGDAGLLGGSVVGAPPASSGLRHSKKKTPRGTWTGVRQRKPRGARLPFDLLLSSFSLLLLPSCGEQGGIPRGRQREEGAPADGFIGGGALGFGRRRMVEVRRGRTWRPSTRAKTEEGGGHGASALRSARPHRVTPAREKGEEEQGLRC